jgi:hypothetical protein
VSQDLLSGGQKQLGERLVRMTRLVVIMTPEVSPWMAGKSAPLAQLVEHLTFNQVVVGSNPTGRTIKSMA